MHCTVPAGNRLQTCADTAERERERERERDRNKVYLYYCTRVLLGQDRKYSVRESERE